MQLAKILLVLVCLMAAWNQAVSATVITDDDPTRVLAAGKRLTEFSKDVLQINLAIGRSVMNGRAPEQESTRAILCLQQVQSQAFIVDYYMHAATIALEISSQMRDALDERDALRWTELALSGVSTALVDARTAVNEIIGGCARRSQLAYDKAEILMGLFDETSRIVLPILKRVELAN